MPRLGWVETKILFCVLLASFLSPVQQGVVPAPTQISLVVWLARHNMRAISVLEHLPLILPFFMRGGVALHDCLVGNRSHCLLLYYLARLRRCLTDKCFSL